jgi:asparagine synthase (glutamine-hydrolysing)
MARDRAGKKPLFYSFTKDSLIVASEIKNITSFPDFTDYKISKAGFIQYLSTGYIISPNSIYNSIFKIRPGFQYAYDGIFS